MVVEQQDSSPPSVEQQDGSPPSVWQILVAWLMLGLQSFGGGTATLYLIQRAMVEERHWITAEDFTRSWGVCQIAPGINLVGITILIGWRVRRATGVALALFGLLFPSVTITVLMTALYHRFQDLAVVQAAFQGIVPGTIGLGSLLAWRLAKPLLKESRDESRASFGLSVVLLVGSAALVILAGLPVVVVLWSAGSISALAAWRRTKNRRSAESSR
jgi:chromate transporter